MPIEYRLCKAKPASIIGRPTRDRAKIKASRKAARRR
jgi:hypothetical protein